MAKVARQTAVSDHEERVKLPRRPLRTGKEVAVLLSMKEPTIRDWVYQRKVSYCKVGGAVRFSEEHVAAMMEECPKRDFS